LYQSIKTESVHLKPTKISEISGIAMEKFYTKYPKAKICFTNSNEKVLADTEHLSEAVYNLLVNGQESVLDSQSLNEDALQLHCSFTRQYVVIDVYDKGTGMSKKEIKKIFDPFYSRKNSNQNWGMGLYYVRSVIKEHMGMIKLESIEKEGTHFYIILPKLKGWVHNLSEQIKIIIAEDFPLLLEDLKEQLEQVEDMMVVGGGLTAKEEIGKAETIDHELILMDIEMENINDGIDAAEEIVGKNPNDRIISLTAHETQKMILSAMGTGAIDYIVKGTEEP